MSKQFFLLQHILVLGLRIVFLFRKNYIWTRCYFSQENQKKCWTWIILSLTPLIATEYEGYTATLKRPFISS